ncbi:tRNA pseudouridine(55) synthase TruB [bacterium]|nr:tRNA pseudouridine(55) synthase TruB [bacterium]
MTSFDVVARVRRVTGIKKTGHAGTLDPMATGLLVVGVGKATKLLGQGLTGGKTYEAVAQLGLTSPTHDRDSDKVLSVETITFTRDQVESALLRLASRTKQIPPLVSALKVKGQPLHKVARRGWWLPRDSRPLELEALNVLDYDAENASVRFTVSGGGGTYVRSLVRDLGTELGVPAVLTELRRVAAGPYKIEQCIPLDSLEQRWGEFTQSRGFPSDESTG